LAGDDLLHGDAGEIADLAPLLEARPVIGLRLGERRERELHPRAAAHTLHALRQLRVLPDARARGLARLQSALALRLAARRELEEQPRCLLVSAVRIDRERVCVDRWMAPSGPAGHLGITPRARGRALLGIIDGRTEVTGIDTHRDTPLLHAGERLQPGPVG